MWIYEGVRLIHVLGGAFGLLLAPIPIVTKKGGPLHRRVGKLFVLAMTAASVSGLVMAASWLIAPLLFSPAGSNADPGAARVSGLFLATLALITLGGIQQLVRAPTRKRTRRPAPTRLDCALPSATALVGAATLVAGSLQLRPLLIEFGALAMFAAGGNLRFVLRPLPTKMAWWYQHMSGAMVTVIATLTAFLVFGGQRIVVGLVPPSLGWILWIAPSIILVPTTTVWIRRYERRFGERTA